MTRMAPIRSEILRGVTLACATAVPSVAWAGKWGQDSWGEMTWGLPTLPMLAFGGLAVLATTLTIAAVTLLTKHRRRGGS